MTLKLQATPEEVMRAVEALRDFASKGGVTERDLFGLALALEECASNVVNHSLRREQKFQVTFQKVGASFVIELRDPGPRFDPTLVQVKPQANDDDLPGGWGIQIVRRYTDEIRYAREGSENVLRLTKRLSPPEKIVRSNIKPSAKHCMSLSIEIQNDSDPRYPGVVTIKLAGSLDTATAPELERQMLSCLAGPANDLVFDLAGLKFVSSAGLRLFQVARKQMVARGGGRASFINMQPQVEEVFTIIQSLPGIGVFKDLEALDRYLATRPRPNTWGGKK